MDMVVQLPTLKWRESLGGVGKEVEVTVLNVCAQCITFKRKGEARHPRVLHHLCVWAAYH